MSYTSKKNIVSVVAGIALIIAYIIYATGANAPALADVKSWAVAVLVFVGIGIGVQIVVQVLFHISLTIVLTAKEEIKMGSKNSDKEAERIIKAEMVEDEWSKIIELKACRIGYVFIGMGVCATVIALAAGAEMVIALHILFGMSALSSVAEGISGIIYHERGVK